MQITAPAPKLRHILPQDTFALLILALIPPNPSAQACLAGSLPPPDLPAAQELPQPMLGQL